MGLDPATVVEENRSHHHNHPCVVRLLGLPATRNFQRTRRPLTFYQITHQRELMMVEHTFSIDRPGVQMLVLSPKLMMPDSWRDRGWSERKEQVTVIRPDGSALPATAHINVTHLNIRDPDVPLKARWPTIPAPKPYLLPAAHKSVEYNKEHDIIGWLTSQKGEARFTSRDGHMYGMDSDASITLSANNRASVTEFGAGIQTYEGSFSSDEKGLIHLTLRAYPSVWPDMYLFRSTRGAVLMRRDQNPSFHMGGQGGATETPNMIPYWPFRQMNPRR